MNLKINVIIILLRCKICLVNIINMIYLPQLIYIVLLRCLTTLSYYVVLLRCKNGFRISYINKLTKLQLESIIIKYDMNIDELMFELAEQREAEMIARQEGKGKISENIKRKNL